MAEGNNVISFLSDYHEGSYLNLTNQKTGLQKALSVELHITSNYPPTYAFSNKDLFGVQILSGKNIVCFKNLKEEIKKRFVCD